MNIMKIKLNLNKIKFIYYRYKNTTSSLDLNIVILIAKTTDNNIFFRKLILFQDNFEDYNNKLIEIIYA